jgi:hypothetical protein
MQPIIDKIGYGWFFTLLGLLSGIYGLGAYLCVMAFGMEWRQRRSDTQES